MEKRGRRGGGAATYVLECPGDEDRTGVIHIQKMLAGPGMTDQEREANNRGKRQEIDPKPTV